MLNRKSPSEDEVKLVLVDGSSYLYRAYHALPDLRGPHNIPSGALYGIISMLKRIRRNYPSIYGACIFDARGKTFRNDIYAAYKANRPSMPDDLSLQIPSIHKAVAALGWPILIIEGVEADDVIGTLTKWAFGESLKVLISTGDKDMAQLVNEKVALINTMNEELLDKQGVLNKFGVGPELIPDYLSLTGDSIDNVPGVAKVGPKTAVKWLQAYGSLEGVISASDKIKGVIGENLRSVLDWLPIAKRLLTIKCDCQIPKSIMGRDEITDSLSGLKFLNPNKKELLALYEQHGFESWIRELRRGDESEVHSLSVIRRKIVDLPTELSQERELKKIVSREKNCSEEAVIERAYELIVDSLSFDSLIDSINLSSLTSLDIETTSTNPIEAKIVGFSFSVLAGFAYYIPVGHHCLKDGESQLKIEYVLDHLRDWLENPLCLKVGQNLKYDRQVLRNYNISLSGIAHDTLLQSYILESHHRHDLGRLAKRHLNLDTISYESLCGKGVNQICFDQVSLTDACRYASEDADLALQLHHILYPKIVAENSLHKIYENIEIPLISVLTDIERTGVNIDVNLLNAQSMDLNSRLQSLETKVYEFVGTSFNLNSPKQIGEIFFKQLGLPIVKKTPTGTPSTDDEVLQKLAANYPLPKLILDYRALSKLKATYVDKLPRMISKKTGRVHTSYGQAVAVTGRLTSNDPNLQNIPIRTEEGRRIREAFVSPPDYKLLSADYSQIELRIMAHLSQDSGLMRAFLDGRDVHRATASEIFSTPESEINTEQRRIAKTINFGLIYGMSAFGLANNLGITREAAKQYIQCYFSRYPKVAIFMEETRAQAKHKGFVETILGRRLWLPEINISNAARRQAAERAAINAPMQGTAADMIKLSMIAADKWLRVNKCKSKMIMQVHDELVFEIADDEIQLIKKELPRLMCGVIELCIPLQVDIGIGKNWDEAH